MRESLLTVKTAVAAFFAVLGTLVGWKGILVLTWVVLMFLDYLTGTLAAMKAGQWCSQKAREGGWHKCGAIIVVLVAAIADGIMLVICGNLPLLNIAWPGMILPLMLSWYILTELGSILENAIRLGANPPGWLSGLLVSGKKAVDAAGSRTPESEAK